MRSIARHVSGVVALVVLWAGYARAEAVKDLAQPTSYVDDLAGVIDADSKAKMEALAAEVERKAHATIEIATIHSLDGQPIEEFATELQDKWKVGPKGTDRGVLMIFAVNDRKRRIEVGYGLEGVLNDAKVGDIGRNMMPDLQAGEYGRAILGGEQQVAQEIAQDAGVTLAPMQPLPQQQQRQQSSKGRGGIGIVPLIVVVLFFLFLFRGGRGGRGGGGGGSGWLPWFVLGNLMGSGRGGYRGGGGGGFGGGGGDDGGFSGGFGGGSGGGGASGDWMRGYKERFSC